MDLRDKILFEPPEIGCVLSLTGLPGGGSYIYDRSPYGNIGTIVGANWVRLPSGLWVLSFDGNDDYVDCGKDASLDVTDITIDIWTYKVTTADSRTFIARGDGSSVGWMLYSRVASGFAARFITEGGNATITGTTNLTNSWHKVTVTKVGDDFVIYVNAVPETSTTSSQNVNTTQKLVIGASNEGAGSFWKGFISLPRIYNRALSALEIQNHFNREKHLFGVW